MAKKERESGLRPGGFPQLLLTALESGGKKTINEWAKHFKVEPRKIATALTRIRKEGYLFYSSGSEMIQGVSSPGIIIDILDNKKVLLNAIERHDRVRLLPALESAFRIFERAVAEYPELYEHMETRLSSILVRMMNEKEQLKLSLKNGNRISTD